MVTALVLIDVQRAFDDPYWGRRNNPSAESNIAVLRSAWEAARLPIVVVRHDSVQPGSPLAPGQPGNALKPELDGIEADLHVGKTVNSAFHGDVDLDRWLRSSGIGGSCSRASRRTCAWRRRRGSAATSGTASPSRSTPRSRST